MLSDQLRIILAANEWLLSMLQKLTTNLCDTGNCQYACVKVGLPVFEPGCDYCLLSVEVEIDDAKRRRARTQLRISMDS